MRSPDVAWVRREKLATLTREQKKKFLPLAPDFVIELRSPTDRLKPIQKKMNEYMANEVEMGWLVNPPKREVHIYFPGRPAIVLENAGKIDGDPILPNFTLDFAHIWEPDF